MPSLTLFGHAFGQDFSLPLPAGMFIFGGVAAVLLSFVLISLLSGEPDSKRTGMVKRFNVPALAVVGRIASGLGLAIFLLAVVSGFVGSPYASKNINVTLFWVVLLVGFTYLTAVFGNFWKVVNPFRTIVRLLEALLHKPFAGSRPYPERLGYYPALVGYSIVVCLEVIFRGIGTDPPVLSGLLVYYAILCIVGSGLYGTAAFFRYAEFFSVYFRLVAKLSPFVYLRQQLVIRSPLSGLLQSHPANMSLVLFIVFMLGSTTFDGFRETRQYAQLYAWLPAIPPLLLGVGVLVGITLTLFALYLLFVRLSKALAPTGLSGRQLCFALAYTLLPIAVGYNVAHYFSYLVANGQNLIFQVSDPLNLGWDMFGTAGFKPVPTLLSPYVIWYLQVASIVVGHILAVYAAHKAAQAVYKKNADVVLSQLPIIVLMLVYTTISLWIVAQPIYVATAKAQENKVKQMQQWQNLRQQPMPDVPR